VIIASFFLASGRYTPLYDLVNYLPVFNLFRVPARWSLVSNFALAMLAAFSFEAYLRRPGGRRLRLSLCALWGIATMTMLGLWFLRESLLQWVASVAINGKMVDTLTGLLSGPSLIEAADAYKDRIILGSLAWWVLPPVALVSRLGLAIALLVTYPRFLSRRVFISAVVTFTAFDLALSGGSAINHLTRADYWKQLSTGARYIIETKQDDRARFLSQVRKPEKDVVAGLGQYFASVYQVSNTWGHESPLNLERYVALTEGLEKNPMMALSLTNTRYLLTNEYLDVASHVPFQLIHQGDDNWYVYENLAVLPRAFVVHQTIVVVNESEALKTLEDEGFNSRRSVILETVDRVPALSPTRATEDAVMIVSEEPTSIEFEVTLDSNGFFVLLDNFYPGWKAYVDGQPQTIHRANYFARAVYLDEGKHQVKFIYQPTSFYSGLVLSAVGWVILLASIWSTWVRHKHLDKGTINQSIRLE